MVRQVKPHSTGQALSEQLAAQAAAVRLKYGPHMGWPQLLQLLADRSFTHYPCEVRFDAEPLLPGEFAHTVPQGLTPEIGFVIYVHPMYRERLPELLYLVLHQLVVVNHGLAASAEDAETFGALALGLSREEYYRILCELSARLSGDELV